jgi:hypothetical protein
VAAYGFRDGTRHGERIAIIAIDIGTDSSSGDRRLLALFVVVAVRRRCANSFDVDIF